MYYCNKETTQMLRQIMYRYSCIHVYYKYLETWIFLHMKIKPMAAVTSLHLETDKHYKAILCTLFLQPRKLCNIITFLVLTFLFKHSSIFFIISIVS